MFFKILSIKDSLLVDIESHVRSPDDTKLSVINDWIEYINECLNS